MRDICGVRGHFKAAEFDEAQAAAGGIGRVEFVDAEFGAVGVAGEIDEEIAEDAIDEPRAAADAGGDFPRSGICCIAISSS